MLQQLVEVKREVVLCDSVYSALGGILQGLFVLRLPFVDLVSKGSQKPEERPDDEPSASDVFDRVTEYLEAGKWIDGTPQITETATGLRRLRITNPLGGVTELSSRVKLGSMKPPAALLRAFLLLRVIYQETVRLEARKDEGAALDALYLIGDAFTERYPVRATLEAKGDTVSLTLRGEPQRVPGDGSWDRQGYIQARDACLLLRPLKEAIEGPRRPLVIPRELHAERGERIPVRVRVPASASEPIASVRKRITAVHWLEILRELKNLPRPEQDPPLPAQGALGEHASYETATGGYVVGTQGRQIEEVLPMRILANAAPTEVIQPWDAEGRLAITLEGLGGAREIGANAYYYQFGERGLLVDVGYDATRDGWMGLPALDRITRLDAVILTHAHIDHIGSLPLLLDVFPEVPVYCTRATLGVLQPMLLDSAKVSGFRFEETGEMPAISRGMVSTLAPSRFRSLEYGVETQVPEIPGLSLQFHDAGHIIGSANARLGFAGTEILHTGDISVEDQHLLRGMRIEDQRAQHVVMEGTYSGEPSFNREQRRQAILDFFAAMEERLDAGGSVLVPAFSLGRAQELVGMLVDWRKEKGRNFPLYTVGMVNTLNEISGQLPEFLPGLQGQPFKETQSFDVGDQRNMSDDERRAAYERTFREVAKAHPCVIIASHGMMMEKTGSYFIGRAILTGDNEQHAIFLCGYMDPRTPGYRLHHQCCEPIIDYGIGDAILRKLPTERIRFYRLTAHASYEELVQVGTRIPLKSVTLIHGEAKGLDALRDDLVSQLSAEGRTLQVRAPALGERILLEHVPPPANWEFEPTTPRRAERLGPDIARPRGFTLRGLTRHGAQNMALIPIGEQAVMLALETDRVSPARIVRVEVPRGAPGGPASLYDRERNQGNLLRLPWSTPGRTTWVVTAQDPDGRLVQSRITLLCGPELRAISTALNANEPVLELEVGGRHEPHLEGLSVEGNPNLLQVLRSDWDPVSRVLKLKLRAPFQVRSLEDVRIDLRWDDGWVQQGFPLGTLTLEPRVELSIAPARVGVPTSLQVESYPQPRAARFDGRPERLEAGQVSFTPRRPGALPLELQYGADDGQWEWRTAELIDVLPSATVQLPRVADLSRDLEVLIRDIEPALHGVLLELRVDDAPLTRWKAGAEPHRWSGPLSSSGDLEVELVAPGERFVLWRGMLHVRAGLELDKASSLPVTSADGSLEAKLAWPHLSEEGKEQIQQSFETEGFTGLRWDEGTLSLRGTPETEGAREIVLVDASSYHRVSIVTLPSNVLRLEPASPNGPGDRLLVSTTGGSLDSGFEATDGGPLSVVAERLSPLMDTLSAVVDGTAVQFLHPGRYRVSLMAWGKHVAHLETEVRPPPPPLVIPQLDASEFEVASVADASDQIAQLPPGLPVLALRPVGGSFHVLRSKPEHVVDAAWKFVRDRLDQHEQVMVVTAGLALPQEAGRLLCQLRKELPKTAAAHLSYPVPRGELASDLEGARRLHEHVKCVIPAGKTIDRFDAYTCVRCEASMLLQSDEQSLWLRCTSCGFEDREVVLTLDRFRRENVRVLFTDYRVARYLQSETGRRYAGAFGRTVCCTQCKTLQPAFSRPGPWDGALLQRLVSAMASSWKPDNEASSIRRAARRAAQRSGKAQPGELQRLERALRQLVDSGVLVQGKPVLNLKRLEQGLSLCCGRALAWSSSRISHVFLDLGALQLPSALHPKLLQGAEGLRQLLDLAQANGVSQSAASRPTGPKGPPSRKPSHRR